VDRRRLLSGFGAAAGGVLTAGAPATAGAAPGGARPVAPVNHLVAARHGIAYTAMPPQAVGVDVESLITIDGAAAAASRRTRLIGHLWKGAGRPTGLPAVRRGVSPRHLADLTRVRRVDELTVPLRYGVSSTVFHLLPARSGNRRLAVYHNGHGEPLGTMVRTVQALLDEGCSVLVLAMPFVHWNAQPIVDPRDPGRRVTVHAHDELARWESAAFSTLTFFVEPVTVALNHAIAAHRPSSVQMIGLSGGGWTTTVCAAIDPRITHSYPAAGSLPFHLRPGSPNVTSSLGDWEQRRETQPRFYGIAGYLDLYVMAAVGPGRRQIQILNRFDSCCFAGVGHRSYAPAVSQRAAVIGAGHWEVLEDATHDQHTISPYALSVILWDLATARDEPG
jgi:hypothetical protein